MSTAGGGTGAALADGTGPASPHEASAGRISVAMPGGVSDARTAACADGATSAGPEMRRTQFDIGAARLSMSLVSGASSGRW